MSGSEMLEIFGAIATIMVGGVGSYVHLLIKTGKQEEQIKMLFNLHNETKEFEREIRDELKDIKTILMQKQ